MAAETCAAQHLDEAKVEAARMVVAARAEAMRITNAAIAKIKTATRG
jgi:hypothetical protein